MPGAGSNCNVEGISASGTSVFSYIERMSRNTKTCLIIDDDTDDQEIFAAALDELGGTYKCVAVSSGVDALKMFRENIYFTPDYIFLDLNMPRLNGKECLREIKAIPHLTDIPVIIYTTSTSSQDIIDTRKLGATSFITKPFSISELMDVLKTFFQEYESVEVKTIKD